MREDIPIKKIGDVCQVIPGQSPKSKFYNDKGEGLPFYQGKKRFTDKFLDTPVKWTTNITKEAVDGDILMSVRAPVGPVNFATQKICIGRGLAAIRPKEKVNRDYLFYFFLKNEADLESTSGAVFDSINSKQIRNIKIPIPPLPEQKRVVAILDEAFEAIDQAKANIERNIENAEELFQSKLNGIFSQRGEGWEEKPLGQLTYVKSGGTPRRSTKEYWENGSIPWYSSGELNDLFTNESKDLITEKGLKESNAKLFPIGSLLIGMYDTAALKMSILDRDGAFNQAISGAKPNKDLNLQFVMHAINAIKPELMKQRRGVRQKNLNLTKVKAIPIPFPKIEVQNEVVAHLSELQDYTETLIESYQNKLGDLNELKKSILQKAFSGELTANEQVAA